MGRDRKMDFEGVFRGISRVWGGKLLKIINFGIVMFDKGV